MYKRGSTWWGRAQREAREHSTGLKRAATIPPFQKGLPAESIPGKDTWPVAIRPGPRQDLRPSWELLRPSTAAVQCALSATPSNGVRQYRGPSREVDAALIALSSWQAGKCFDAFDQFVGNFGCAAEPGHLILIASGSSPSPHLAGPRTRTACEWLKWPLLRRVAHGARQTGQSRSPKARQSARWMSSYPNHVWSRVAVRADMNGCSGTLYQSSTHGRGFAGTRTSSSRADRSREAIQQALAGC